MKYVKTSGQTVVTYPYTIGNLRQENPNTSFPKSIPDATLSDYGVYPVSDATAPDYDPRTQNAEYNQNPELVNDQWVLGITVTNKTAEQIAEYDAGIAEDNRTTRNKLLADSDWTQMNDSPLTNEVKTQGAVYRSELRGITDLDAWPNLADEDWPVAP